MIRYVPKYFSPEEFKRCTPSCSIDDMDSHFLYYLDRVRCACGFPIKINSAYRSPEYEVKKGRSGTSSHTKGLAVDIHCIDSFQRVKIIGTICDMSNFFKEWPIRIGIGKTFLHIDIDMEKQQGIWVY